MKNLIKKILKYEKKHTLFKNKFKNYAIWPYYRMYFYYSISKDLNLLNNSVSGFKKDFNYIKKILNIFNLKKLFEKKEIFILEHPRSNKEKKDIYTYDIVNYIGKEKCSFFTFSNNGIVEKSNEIIILDLLKIISKIYSIIIQKFIKVDEHWINFLNEFKNINKIKYVQQYKRYQLELQLQYYFYYFLLKLKKTKKIIIVVSYYNMPLIFAAKNLDIEVIEMQHGIISKYHLGYHYPYYETNFFPDKLLTFSTFWNNSANYPKSEIIAVGNNFLYTKKNTIKKHKNTILIISQTTIGKKLKNFLLQNIKDLKNYQIYFKLHPNEFNNHKKNYTNLLQYKNIHLITNQYNIHQLQNFCEYQIGIYSTAVYEGIERKCKTLLLNDTGIEYMEQILRDNLADKINYTDNLKNKLLKITNSKSTIFFNQFKIKGNLL